MVKLAPDHALLTSTESTGTSPEFIGSKKSRSMREALPSRLQPTFFLTHVFNCFKQEKTFLQKFGPSRSRLDSRFPCKHHCSHYAGCWGNNILDLVLQNRV